MTLALDTAKRLVLELWRKYERKPGANVDMEMGSFYLWLEEKHPDALRFRLHSSKWEMVSAWLKHDDKVQASIGRATRI